MQNPVAAIDDVALPGNENVLTLREEDLFGLARLAGKTEKFKIDGWRRGRPLRTTGPDASVPARWASESRFRRGKCFVPYLYIGCPRWPSASHSAGWDQANARARCRIFFPGLGRTATVRCATVGGDHHRGWSLGRCRRAGKKTHYDHHQRHYRQADGRDGLVPVFVPAAFSCSPSDTFPVSIAA